MTTTPAAHAQMTAAARPTRQLGCMDDAEPEDTLEADLAASLAAVRPHRKTDADYREEARANHARLRALYPET